ncbi:hypothetical protein TELCIR_06496 [Teladorsagia circumcincta]|uniref:Uncharacterized protein n=1 Tax=Teladorsagia circumcincta TaxID=45464 RepID=A0A2G9UPG4_TELCI|nr:hypothetical protein TELCIR_06496 [Teladorsagia circumcincta]
MENCLWIMQLQLNSAYNSTTALAERCIFEGYVGGIRIRRMLLQYLYNLCNTGGNSYIENAQSEIEENNHEVEENNHS